MKKVNLFIVGAMKAGTTSFVDTLSKHKDVFVCPVKEPHFFVDHLPKKIYEPSRYFNLEYYLQNDFPKPLHITKIKTFEQYGKIFSTHNNQKYLLEASTAYLTSVESPKLIRDYNPHSKIIILTRNPLERSFSHYRMMVGLSRENRSFEEVIRTEIDLHKKGKLSPYSYIGMSLYKKSIARYKSYFKDVLVIDFEDLLKNKTRSFKNITDFLEIDSFDEINLKQTNQTRSLRFQKLFFLLKKMGMKDLFSLIFTSKMKQAIFRLVSQEKKEYLDLPLDLKKELLGLFNKIEY